MRVRLNVTMLDEAMVMVPLPTTWASTEVHCVCIRVVRLDTDTIFKWLWLVT
jgi:hypothetical protein